MRRVMRENGLLAPHRVGRTEAKPHDGTIVTDKVNEMWGTDMTQTITIREGRANVFVAVEHANSEVIGIHASRSANRFEALERCVRGCIGASEPSLPVWRKLMLASPDQQISLTDPDSRSMATSGRGSGVVGYNVEVAVDTEHHRDTTHEVTNDGTDRAQLANIACQAKKVLGVDELEAVADRGYYSGEEILACHEAGIAVTLPKPMTSGIEARGRFGKQDFVYLSDEDVYRCPAGEKLNYDYTNEEDWQQLQRDRTNTCRDCALKPRCTTGKERRITRWEHEHVLEAVQKRLDKICWPCASVAIRRRASLRHAENQNGSDPLPDETPAQGRHRDGAARLGLQSNSGHEHYGLPAADGSNEGIANPENGAHCYRGQS